MASNPATTRFSIVAERAAGHSAAQAWFETNPEHAGNWAIAQFGGYRPFEDYTPAQLAEFLGLSEEAWNIWWNRFGTDQPPSNSFTRGFCETIAKLAPAPLPAKPEQPQEDDTELAPE